MHDDLSVCWGNIAWVFELWYMHLKLYMFPLDGRRIYEQTKTSLLSNRSQWNQKLILTICIKSGCELSSFILIFHFSLKRFIGITYFQIHIAKAIDNESRRNYLARFDVSEQWETITSPNDTFDTLLLRILQRRSKDSSAKALSRDWQSP